MGNICIGKLFQQDVLYARDKPTVELHLELNCDRDDKFLSFLHDQMKTHQLLSQMYFAVEPTKIRLCFRLDG